jgi:hypothetical protein
LSVIPAKAGIQSHIKQRLRLWIPAFAGMTMKICGYFFCEGSEKGAKRGFPLRHQPAIHPVASQTG